MREIQAFEYLETEKSFVDEIKSNFHNFVRDIILVEKAKKWDTSFKIVEVLYCLDL